MNLPDVSEQDFYGSTEKMPIGEEMTGGYALPTSINPQTGEPVATYGSVIPTGAVSYTHLRAHETDS